ncbi:MAG: class I SAM-dependent methyltransferase [Acidimicrobiales bacterium]
MGRYLPPWPLHGVEICCGTGRYLRRLASSRSPGSLTVGVDLNESMLCRASSARKDPSGVVRLVRADCCRLPFSDASLGWISIIDAIHLVDIHRVVEEAARVLASGGVLLVYTRTPAQNARSLLGRLFPQFSEKERRLLTEDDLRCAVDEGGLRIEALVRLNHEKSASRKEVLAQVKQRPYSTFVFYTAAEWSSAIEAFASRLEHSGSDTVSWTDENLLLVCRRGGAV